MICDNSTEHKLDDTEILLHFLSFVSYTTHQLLVNKFGRLKTIILNQCLLIMLKTLYPTKIRQNQKIIILKTIGIPVLLGIEIFNSLPLTNKGNNVSEEI